MTGPLRSYPLEGRASLASSATRSCRGLWWSRLSGFWRGFSTRNGRQHRIPRRTRLSWHGSPFAAGKPETRPGQPGCPYGSSFPDFFWPPLLSGLPLLIYSIVYGCVLLLGSPFSVPARGRLRGCGAGQHHTGLDWTARGRAPHHIRSQLEAHATVGAKARFAFYWLVSLGLVASAIWPKRPISIPFANMVGTQPEISSTVRL